MPPSPISPPRVRPGIECIPADWLRGARTGLVAHPASRTADGEHAADHLHRRGVRLAALFGPEHGFYGRGGPGEPVDAARHPDWDIPIHSLYGATRAPTPEMLAPLDAVVFDLQTIACRAYTYGSTLRLLMEACAAAGKTLVVADRPDPLMLTPPDGPMLSADCESFVGFLPTPFCHGMTPGELAAFLKETLGLHALDLRIARCEGLSRGMALEEMFPVWHAPSPAIVSLDNALAFPLNVFFEALPLVDHARGTPLAFLRAGTEAVDLAGLGMPSQPGLEIAPAAYTDAKGEPRRGLRFRVADPRRYRPAQTAWTLWTALAGALGGWPALWATPGARHDFHDKLWGSHAPAPPWPAGPAFPRFY
ncbi:MAG: DUF1343 domain-containing protein [Kiritimatiellae bacterium]|nr:DUF1343 domain-containing protein [Kiritimatiellia bacterium]MBR4251180.1 DUF1343 domain-containing protein [Kiritimatiellia bacterium]